MEQQAKTPPFLEKTEAEKELVAKLSCRNLRPPKHTDRMMRMMKEMRNGKLSWNMIRENIGELEVSLKMEILKVVGKKIAEGDLLTLEAVLAVPFPFLNDYDKLACR